MKTKKKRPLGKWHLIVIFTLSLSLQSCLTLTTGKQTVNLTSEPSGAKVFRGTDLIGTTPCTYTSKKAVDVFTFKKDGYLTQGVNTKKEGRWLAYGLGNCCFGIFGYLIDIPYVYKYTETNYHAKLEVKPVPVIQPTQPTTDTGILSQGYREPRKTEYVRPNARAEVKTVKIPVKQRHKLSKKAIFKKYTDAVFMIHGFDDYNHCQGSGFVIHPSGLAISNYHNFEGNIVMLVKMYGNDVNGYEITFDDVIAYSKKDDYIIFKLPKKILTDFKKSSFTYIPVAYKSAETGDEIVTIGSPKGLENTLSSGDVSQVREGYLQINAPIDHGSSGGALINMYGEAVGITTAGFDNSGANLNFCKDLVKILNQFK